MPNWVTTKIQAPEHVIRAMLNDKGEVDFNAAAPFPGPHQIGDVYVDAETAAESACRVPTSSNALVAMLQSANRADSDIAKMAPEAFEQYTHMLENFRACGYLHPMHFAREVWGTKWNACNPTADPEAGRCQFETAWACPSGALRKVSERFPDDTIEVVYADEDIGSNCGSFSLKGGQLVARDVAPSWRDMSGSEKVKWKAFAYEVKGWKPEDDEPDPT